MSFVDVLDELLPIAVFETLVPCFELSQSLSVGFLGFLCTGEGIDISIDSRGNR
jgi:hypothetical protein